MTRQLLRLRGLNTAFKSLSISPCRPFGCCSCPFPFLMAGSALKCSGTRDLEVHDTFKIQGCESCLFRLSTLALGASCGSKLPTNLRAVSCTLNPKPLSHKPPNPKPLHPKGHRWDELYQFPSQEAPCVLHGHRLLCPYSLNPVASSLKHPYILETLNAKTQKLKEDCRKFNEV